MNLDWLPVTRSTLENEKRATAETAKAEADELLEEVKAGFKEEIARLEGLLDAEGELDQVGPHRAELYREITGLSGNVKHSRDLPPDKRRRIISLAHLVYALRGMGENLIDSTIDFVLGDELKPNADKNDQLQKILDEAWDDPENRLLEKHETYTLTLLIEGELFLRTWVSPLDGHSELGWIDPLSVVEVIKDKRGRDAYLMVQKGATSEKDRLFVLNSLTDKIKIEPSGTGSGKWELTEETELGEKKFTVDGFAFACFWARPEGASRGRSELGSVIDLIDAFDEMIWSSVEIQNLRRWFLMHVVDPKIRTKKDGLGVLKRYGLQRPPRNPKVFATNEKVQFNLLTLDGDHSGKGEGWLAKELGTSIMGSKGMPEGWRGSMSDKGLAGARAADYLPLRRLRRKQRKIRRFWRQVIEIQLELRRRVAGVSIASDAWDMAALEVGGRDKARGAEIVKALAAAIVQAETSGIAKPELLNAVFVQALREAGLAVDKKLEGVPDKEDDPVEQLDAVIRQLGSQKSRTDEGNEDEGDRDRSGERIAQ